MKSSYKLGLAAIVVSISLVGCGGGSSSNASETVEKVTGQFVDAPVSGLNYLCDPSGIKDVTNADGNYTCNKGDTVTFSLGAYVLGSTTASSGIVTPYDIQDDENASINVARLLQTLDTNDSDGIITIPDNFTALDDSTVELNASFSDFETQIIEDLNDSEITDLIGSDAAQENMDNDILYSLVAGKTLYLADYDFVDKMVFNADASLITWTEVTPGETNPENGEFPVEILEGHLVITTDGGTKALTFLEQTDTYIEFFEVIGQESIKFYYNQADAEAYYDSLNIVRNFFVGNTIYFGTEEGITGYRTYAVDGTYTGSITLADGTTTLAVSGTYIIDGNDVGLYRDTPSSTTIVLIYIGEEAGGIAFDASGVASAAFQTEAERDAYVAPFLPEPSITAETFVSGKSFDIGDGMILTFGSDYSFSDTDGCSGTWSEVTSNSLAVTGGCSFDVTFNGELVDGVAVTINVTDESPAFTFNTTFTEVASSTTPPSTDPTLADLLAGKTVYGENNYDAWTFNETMTQISIIDVDALPGSTPEIIDISVEGNIITADGGATTIEALYQDTDIKLTWLTGPDAPMVDNLWFDLATLESILGM